ncbi:hypothetical protein TYRP_020045 [Tyrophagus putrescentiae]|nr:hypothetical protein TYRP_020045 [Tyrophagus putrescentiae]
MEKSARKQVHPRTVASRKRKLNISLQNTPSNDVHVGDGVNGQQHVHRRNEQHVQRKRKNAGKFTRMKDGSEQKTAHHCAEEERIRREDAALFVGVNDNAGEDGQHQQGVH